MCLTHLAMFCSITMFYALCVFETMVLVANTLPLTPLISLFVLFPILIYLKDR